MCSICAVGHCSAHGGPRPSLMLEVRARSARLEERASTPGPSMIVIEIIVSGLILGVALRHRGAGADAAIRRCPDHEPLLRRVPDRRRLCRATGCSRAGRVSPFVGLIAGRAARPSSLNWLIYRPAADAAGATRAKTRDALEVDTHSRHLRPPVRHAGADARRCSAAPITATPSSPCRWTFLGATVAANRLAALGLAVVLGLGALSGADPDAAGTAVRAVAVDPVAASLVAHRCAQRFGAGLRAGRRAGRRGRRAGQRCS